MKATCNLITMDFNFKTIVHTIAVAACVATIFGSPPATEQEKGGGVAERTVAKPLTDQPSNQPPGMAFAIVYGMR